MFPRLQFTTFLIISLACHILALATAIYLIKPALTPLPTTIPVEIVNLPQAMVKKLPAIVQVPKPVIPNPVNPRVSIPVPVPQLSDKTGVVTIPNTAPTPKSGTSTDGAENTGKSKGSPDSKLSNAQAGGPLPFLSQTDINEFAQKGQTEESTHNPLSDVTEAYKFLPYGRAVFNRLNQNLKFPELASLTGLQGEVYLIFEIKKDGSLGDITITKSSGYKLLDDEVIRTIRDSAPFQPLPEEWHKDRLIFPSVGVFHIYEKRLE